MKKFVVLLMVLFWTWSNAQTVLDTYETTLNKKEISAVYPLFDPITNQSYFFIQDKDSITALQFGVGFLNKDAMRVAYDNPLIGNVVGSRMAAETSPQLFWIDDFQTKISSAKFDFENKNIIKLDDMPLPKEDNVLHYFTDNNIFYTLTVSKKEDKFKLYAFKPNDSIDLISLNLNQFRTLDVDGKPMSILEALKEEQAIEGALRLESIDYDFPTNLLASAKKRKVYVKDHNLVITFDFNHSATQIINFRLDTGILVYKTIAYPSFKPSKSKAKGHNSFLLKDKLFQVKYESDSLAFRVTDWKNERVLKDYKIAVTDPIDEANTPFTYESGTQQPKFLKQRAFFKRMKNHFMGISVYEWNDLIWVTVGGVKENSLNAYMLNEMLMYEGADLRSKKGYPAVFQEFQEPYLFRNIYFDMLFGSNGQSIAGEVPVTAQQEIGYFLSQNPQASMVTVFKRNTYYVLAYYLAKEKKFYFRKFSD